MHRALNARLLLPAGDRILMAVSGGQDSLCLAQLLLDLQPKWHWTLAIAHCDHRWREDSAANAQQVQHLAQTWNLPFHSVVANPPPTTEADARTWRYHQLVVMAGQHDYSVIVTGHTASDRAETLLHNLIRGAGADGLQALVWQRSLTEHIRLARPLLNLTRRETEQFCADRQLPVWHDSTNDNPTYTRNRIRHHILPLLTAELNPNAEEHLAQTAELLSAEVDYLTSTAAALWHDAIDSKSCSDPKNCGRSPSLNRLMLQPLHLALQRRIIRHHLQHCLSTALTYDHIEKVVALIDAPNRSQTDPLPGGAIAFVQHPWIRVQ